MMHKLPIQKLTWTLSLLFACLTTPIFGQAVTLPYFCGFEEVAENANWHLNVGSSAIVNHPNFVNKWTIGTAAKKAGFNGMYVYTGGDVSKAEYDGTKNMFTTAYREFMSLPLGNYDLSFSWRALGDSISDVLYVYWVPNGVAVNSGLTSSLPAALNTYKLVYTTSSHQYLNGKANWQFAHANVSVTSATPYKLVFLWVNNNTNVYNPGGCIDNVQLVTKANSTDCWVAPTGLTATTTPAGISVSWTGTASSYDLICFMDGAMQLDTVSGITGNSYTIPASQLSNGLYTIWVRAVCPDGTTGRWVEVSGIKYLDSSAFPEVPVACPEITLPSSQGLGALRNIKPDCGGQLYTIRPSIGASGGSIAGYKVDSIPYAPPFPLNVGTPIFVNKDDVWGDVIALPFGFCFFENTYNQAVVGANGIISFNTNVAGQASGYTLTSQPDIPSPLFKNGTNGSNWKNAIYGVCEDIDPNKIASQHTGGGIYYGILGEAPCRTLTVSWYKVPNYGTSCAATMWNSYQIVLYEGTNIIDVYVEDRGYCPSWNEGRGIIGLQNSDGTDGLSAPGRNTTDVWSAHREAWRFSPYTTPVYDVTWYKGVGFSGQQLGKADTLNVTPTDGIDTVTVRLQFGACNGDYFDLADTAIIEWPRVDTLLVNANMCYGETYRDSYFATSVPGVYDTLLVNSRGCDSAFYHLTLTQQPMTVMHTVDTICYGETYSYRGQTFRRAGTYAFRETYTTGCDSVRDTLYLAVRPAVNFSVQTQNVTTGPSTGAITFVSAPTNFTYTLNGVANAPLTGLADGNYTLVVYDENGCASSPQMVTIGAECLDVELLPMGQICGDDQFIEIPYEQKAGIFTTFDVLYDARAHAAGLPDLLAQPFTTSPLSVPLPSGVVPDNNYDMSIVFNDPVCGPQTHNTKINILYPADIVAQKWGDVLSVYNPNYNGGYDFTGFVWYKNGEVLPEETDANLNLTEKGALDLNAYYQVAVKREGEDYAVLSCPIYPISYTGISFPSTITSGEPWTALWPSASGLVEVYSATGVLLTSQRFSSGTINLQLPNRSGIYFVSVLTDQGQHETARVLVK